jgi:DNA polymerase I
MDQKREVRFLLTDIDYKLIGEEQTPVIRLYGKTPKTQILVEVHDFQPYFYVKKNPDLDFIIDNNPSISRWKTSYEELVLRRYFWAGEKLKLYKIYGKNPQKIRLLSQEFEKLGLEIFETDIPIVKRFLIDNNIKCLNVISVKAATIEEKGNEMHIVASYKDIYTVSDSEITSAVLFYPLKILSFTVKVDREEESIQELWQKKHKRILGITIMWGTGTQAESGKFFILEEESKEGEKQLILSFLAKLQEIQPDILCSYQGDSFDLPYLLHRMRILKIPTQLFSIFKIESAYYSKSLLSFRFRGRMCFDLAIRTWGIHPASGRKGLYDVSEEVLGRGKFGSKKKSYYDYRNESTLEHGEVSGNKIYHTLWKEWITTGNQEKLREFAKRSFYDAKLVYDLYWNIGMSGWVETLRITGFPPAESNSCTERLNGEFELMRYMRMKGILIPKRPDKEQIAKNQRIRELYPHEGGTVLYPKGSLHTGVLIADYQSMYPSIMIAQNIGGETIKQWIDASDHGDPKKLFEKQSRSCLSIMEETLIKKRLEKKNKIKQLKQQLEDTSDEKEQRMIQDIITVLDREQNSMKIVANSMYGAHFYIRSRFYTQTLASAIADSARAYLLGIQEGLEEVSREITPCELIYGDTDSTFIKLLDEDLFINIYQEQNLEQKELLIGKLMRTISAILRKLNDRLPNPLELKFEDFAYRAIFKPDRKKSYSYVSLLSDEFVIKGFEAVRSNWSPLARIAQRKVLEILLRQPPKDPNQTSEFHVARQFLIKLGAKILQMSTEELLPKVVILTPIRRAPVHYRAKAPAVEAFKQYAVMEQLDIMKDWMDYDKFPWIITKGEGSVYVRARHPKYVEDIDREHYVTEILRSCEDLGVKVTLREVKGALPGRLDQFYVALPQQELEHEEEKEEQQEGNSILDLIKPVKAGELLWQEKRVSNRRKKRDTRPVGQTSLTRYVEITDDTSD